jgi:hypothetical protein
MPRYVFELKGTDDGEVTAYLVVFPDLPAAWREAQSAALEWVTYAEKNGVCLSERTRRFA